MSLRIHKSKKRPPPLTDADYDHEINLVDHTKSKSPHEHPRSASDALQPSSTRVSDSSSRRHSDAPLYKHTTPLHLREELLRRKFHKYQDRREASDDEHPDESEQEEDNEAQAGEDHTSETNGEPEERGRTSIQQPKTPTVAPSAIDILYENQRGGFLCGTPLFSSKALGALDHAPWTNSGHKPSATDITNAQVPDPSWEWAWKEWHVNLQAEVDEEGWEYSFAFSKKISWHGRHWYNSFVRRRAWTRKRVKKHSGYQTGPHMLTPEYFTIHPADDGRSRGTSMDTSIRNRYSIGSLLKRDTDDNLLLEDIKDIGTLMKILRLARIDREKMEAVENFIQHGGEDLYYLQEHMHDIMDMFIFQASRRVLLAHLLKLFNKASEEREANSAEGKEIDTTKEKRLENLESALRHADEEVKKLEFWSDVKDMAEKGQTKGAVDESQGWDQSWAGLDTSGPKDVNSDKQAPGKENCGKKEGNGIAKMSEKSKGKQKASD